MPRKDIFTICPDLFFRREGKNALRTQKCDRTLTERVLHRVVRLDTMGRTGSLLLYILGCQVDNQLSLDNPGIIDQNCWFTDLDRVKAL